MGKTCSGRGPQVDVPLSARDTEEDKAKQWNSLREAFLQEGQVRLHLNLILQFFRTRRGTAPPWGTNQIAPMTRSFRSDIHPATTERWGCLTQTSLPEEGEVSDKSHGGTSTLHSCHEPCDAGSYLPFHEPLRSNICAAGVAVFCLLHLLPSSHAANAPRHEQNLDRGARIQQP